MPLDIWSEMVMSDKKIVKLGLHIYQKIVGWGSTYTEIELPHSMTEAEAMEFQDTIDLSKLNLNGLAWDYPYKPRDFDDEGDPYISEAEFFEEEDISNDD